jgi:type II protein arginine methyltransferase
MTDDIDLAIRRESAELPDESLDAFEQTLTLRVPADQSEHYINRVYRRMIPRWHFAMINDAERNQAFLAAMQRQVKQGDLVLDVGAGSGLLAMMAVRAGARAAISCEGLEPVAYMARRIVESNGLLDRVTIVPKMSFEMAVGRDLPARADILVTETVDCGLLGEGIIPIVRHARANLLVENARIIPAAARVCFALLESVAIHRNNFVSDAAGFDLSLFNRFSTRDYFPVRLSTWGHRLLSTPTQAFSFDFRSDPLEPRTARVPVEITSSGYIHGIVFWFELDLGAGASLSNDPGKSRSHWMQAVQCLEVPVRMAQGQTVRVEAFHDGNTVQFTLIP